MVICVANVICCCYVYLNGFEFWNNILARISELKARYVARY